MGLKSHLFWLIFSLSFWWSSVLLTSSVQEWKKWLIFYDSQTHQPIPVINPPDNTTSRVQMLRMGPIPCSCQDFTCGCCAFMDIEYFDYHRNGCMNMTYYPNDFALGANMLWNEMSVWSQNISGKNPPPACVQMPIPYLPAMDMCVRMYNIYTPGQNIHMCMNWEFRTERAPLLILEFDCFRWGSDGFANVKPDAPNAGIPTEGMGGGMGGGAMGAPQAEELIEEASENDDNKKNKTKATTPKPSKKATLRPSTAAPFLNLEIEEIPVSNAVVTKNTTNKMTLKENLGTKAPNFNLNVTEFEDADTRVSLLNAPEKVVKININIDNFLNGTVTDKARGYPVSNTPSTPVSFVTNTAKISFIPESTTQKQLRRKREVERSDGRTGKRTTNKKKKKTNNRRRNRNRNRNKNKDTKEKERERERNKLYAPTLSFNIVEMPLSEYKSQKRLPPVSLPTYKDKLSSLTKPNENTKEVVLSYPEPTGARSIGRHRNQKSMRKEPKGRAKSIKGQTEIRGMKSVQIMTETTPAWIPLPTGAEVIFRDAVLAESAARAKKSKQTEARFRGSVRVEPEVHAIKPVREEPVEQTRTTIQIEPKIGHGNSVRVPSGARSGVTVQSRPQSRVRRSVRTQPEVKTKTQVQAEPIVQTKKLIQTEPQGRAKKKKPGNRKTTTESPQYVAPALNFNVFEVEESFNDRFKLDPKLTSVSTPGTRTTVMATTTTSRPAGPDIDININNLYIYLASFTTFRRNETLQEDY